MDSRSRAAYLHAMDNFRALYHDKPRDLHAAASVYAVAELLAEQGRGLHDAKSLKAAVGQYEFLRAQYPGSSLRIAALLAEALIEENDLHDEVAARERYKLLLKQYPHSEQAEEARAGLDGIPGSRTRGAACPRRCRRSSGQRRFRLGPSRPVRCRRLRPPSLRHPPPGRLPTPGRPTMPLFQTRSMAAASPSPRILPGDPAAAHRSGRLAQVKGIRHWSTPTYTRVAIDLGDDVTFEAARVPNPDRIYFDLHGTRLTPELVGKSFSVTDDGFLKKIRAAQFSDNMTRIVLDVNDVSEYSAFLLPDPYRLIIDIHGGSRTTTASPAGATSTAVVSDPAASNPGPVRTATSSLPSSPLTSAKTVPNTVAVRSPNSTEVASLSAQPGRVDATRRPTSEPISAIVPGRDQPEIATARKKSKTAAADAGSALPARAATPTADGETSLVRALGLKIGRIVIDAGHGGHDSGTLGVDGIEEKDVVLDVALRLGKLLHERLGAEIIYTRADDTFVPLETRTAIANKAQADLFLSIHANSSPDESARGVETYYLNFTSSPDALETAARENAVSNQSIHQLSDLVKKIALRDKIDESREFASDVEQTLYAGLTKGNDGLKNRGVKKAPFVVLIGANMPSVLAEISFMTNPRDAAQLRQPEYRQRVAESLYKGVAKYEAGLGGVRAPVLRASAGTR